MPPAADRPSIKSPRERFGAAESADEWIEVLRGETQYADDPFADMTVRLVCGTLHGQSAGKLAAVISESLKEDPLSGRSYAFCSKGRNSVAVLTWKDPVYSIAKYVKTHGTFIWPHENLGRTIEITKAEFDRLLFLKKHEKVSGKVLQKTPESLISCGFHGIIRYEKCS
jgi:transposase